MGRRRHPRRDLGAVPGPAAVRAGVLPKLFRRLAEYHSLDNTGKVSLARFKAFLATHDDRLFTVPWGHATGLDTLVDVRRQTVALIVPPEQIVFIEA